MCCFAFASSNLSTLAMEHMAPIAGTASSVQGVVGTLGAAVDRLRDRPGVRRDRRCRSSSEPRSARLGGFVVIVLTEPKQLFAAIGTPSPGPSPLDSCVPDDFG